MPVFNCERYVAAAVGSILNQTFQNFELLVINDASTDGTRRVLDTFQDPRVKVLDNPVNLGIAGTRNRAIREASGSRYLAWLDADDLALPTRIEKQVNYLDEHPEAVLCSTNVVSMDESGVVTSGPWWPDPRIPSEWSMLWSNPIAQSSVMVRRQVMLDHGLMYEAEHVPAEDYHLWSRLYFVGRFHRLGEVLVHYRVLSSSAYHSNASKAMKSALVNNEVMIARFLSSEVPPFHQALTGFYPDGKEPSTNVAAMREWSWRLFQRGVAEGRWDERLHRLISRDIQERLAQLVRKRREQGVTWNELGISGLEKWHASVTWWLGEFLLRVRRRGRLLFKVPERSRLCRVIVLTNRHGQLGNRLLVFARYIALSRLWGVPLHHEGFGDYAEFFTGTTGRSRVTYPEIGLPWLSTSVRKWFDHTGEFLRAKRLLPRRRVDFAITWAALSAGKPNPRKEEMAAAARGRNQWRVWDELLFDDVSTQLHREELLRYFSLVPALQGRLNTVVSESRSEGRTLVGVHLRRGDYRHFEGGRFYYDDQQYLQVMRKLTAILPGTIRFLLVSNEPLDLAVFSEFDCRPGDGHMVVDCYALAACDYIVGPQSTFTTWASFIGAKPLYWIYQIDHPISLGDFRVVANV